VDLKQAELIKSWTAAEIMFIIVSTATLHLAHAIVHFIAKQTSLCEAWYVTVVLEVSLVHINSVYHWAICKHRRKKDTDVKWIKPNQNSLGIFPFIIEICAHCR